MPARISGSSSFRSEFLLSVASQAYAYSSQTAPNGKFYTCYVLTLANDLLRECQE